MINTFVVLGATGDLSGRLLLPALGILLASGELGTDFAVVGAGHQQWTEEEFRSAASDRLARHAPGLDEGARAALVSRLRYRQVDVENAASVGDVLRLAGAGSSHAEPIAIYLALPTDLLAAAVASIDRSGVELSAGSRIAVEKPFGTDTASAVALNENLRRVLEPAEAVFRVDHVLGMAATRELLGEIGGYEQLWNRDGIESIDILWEETIALEGRARFYDRAGALRDLLQNHLIQLLCAVALLPDAGGIQDRQAARLSVLRAIRPLSETQVTSTRRARYTAGRLADTGGADGQVVPDYVSEHGVDTARNTETFAEVTLLVDLPQWAGMPFRLRAAKALSRRRRGIAVHFRATPHRALWIDFDAESPDTDSAAGAEAAAYVHVLRELLSGGATLSVSADEAEAAWQIFAPVLDAWATDTVPMGDYPAGSGGPS